MKSGKQNRNYARHVLKKIISNYEDLEHDFTIMKEISNGDEEVINTLNDVKRNLDVLKNIYNVSLGGKIDVCLSLPYVIICCNYEAQKRIIDLIKYNGTFDKQPLIMDDEFENALYSKEREMANLIDDNGQVIDVKAFLNMYGEYLEMFFNKNTRFSNYINNQIDLDTLILKYVQIMNAYLVKLKSSDILEDNSFDDEEEVEIEEVSPLCSYIVDGRVVEVCDIEEFRQMMINDGVDISLQEEYVKQMLNLEKRKEEELINLQKDKIKEEIFTAEDLIFISSAKSYSVEASQIVKDIEAVIDLMLEVQDEDEKNELILEANINLTYLKELLNPEEKEEIPKVVYLVDEDNKPLILNEIKEGQKGSYKGIYLDIKKLYKNIFGDREFLNNVINFRVWVKGNDFKIFYSVIKGVIIIIDGFYGDKAFDNFRKLIQTEKFREYYNNLAQNILNNELIDHREYSKMISDELEKSNRVRKLTKSLY